MPVQRVVSTHLLRLTARMARRRYQRMQARGKAGRISPREERRLHQLGITVLSQLRVERTEDERGKWRVVVP